MSRYRTDKSNWPNSDTTEGKYYEIGYKDAEDKLVPLLDAKDELLKECSEFIGQVFATNIFCDDKKKELLNRLNIIQ